MLLVSCDASESNLSTHLQVKYEESQIKYGHLNQNLVSKMDPTDTPVETQEQLELPQDTAPIKLLQLMPCSN